MKVDCATCGRALAKSSGGISIFASGDERIYSYFLCPACDVWTVDVLVDRFLGEQTIHTQGPLPRAEGDERVRLIALCPSPGDKMCDCETHREW